MLSCWCFYVVRLVYVIDYWVFFFFKQKTAYEMRMSDWSSDVCSSDLPIRHTRWWQMFVRLPRPALEWVTVGGIGYALIIGPAIQRPLGDGYLSQALLFAGGLFGVRAFEKVKGVR